MKWIRSQIENLLIAIGFLTKLPIPKSLKFSEKKMGAGLVYAPFIGLLIGTFLVVVNLISKGYFPSYIVSTIVLVSYIYLTGGLHIDGLGDLGDGIFSGKKGLAFYNIMKDSRLGTGGFLTVLFVLFFDYLLLINNLNWKVLLFFPVAGRLGMLLGSVIGNYPDNYEGLGKIFIQERTWKNSWIVLLLTLIIFVIFFSWKGFLIYLILALFTYVLIKRWHKNLYGITGDMLGAIVEYNQLTYLFMAYLLFK